MPAGVPDPPWRISAVCWLVVGLFHLLRRMPRRWMYGQASKRLGTKIRGHLKTPVLDHVAQVLDGMGSTEERERFWDAHVDHLGRSLFESIDLGWAPFPELLDRIEVVGSDVLDEVRAEGRGGVLFLNHIGTPGAAAAALGPRGYDLAMVGNAVNYADANGMYRLDRLEGFIQRMFRRVNVERVLLGEDLPAKMARVLARNGFFAMFIDFPVEEKHNVSVPFGRRMMEAHIGPALLALRHRVPVLMVTTWRTGQNRHRLEVTRLPLPSPELRLRAAAEELLRSAMEQMLNSVRRHPDQWWPWDVVRLSSLPSEP